MNAADLLPVDLFAAGISLLKPPRTSTRARYFARGWRRGRSFDPIVPGPPRPLLLSTHLTQLVGAEDVEVDVDGDFFEGGVCADAEEAAAVTHQAQAGIPGSQASSRPGPAAF